MDAYSEFLRLLGAPGAGLSALADAPQTVGLSALAVDPMGDATAALEARRRQQVEGARAPAWMRDIGANLGNLVGQPLSAFIPPELRDRLPSAGGLANLVLGSLPGSGDYMAARDAIDATGAGISALGDGDYMRAGARGVDAFTALLGTAPFIPYFAGMASKPSTYQIGDRIRKHAVGMGWDVTDTARSQSSGSTYLNLSRPSGNLDEFGDPILDHVKVRISDHDLPPSYKRTIGEADFDVGVGGKDRLDEQGGWADAVGWLARRAGVEPPKGVQRYMTPPAPPVAPVTYIDPSVAANFADRAVETLRSRPDLVEKIRQVRALEGKAFKDQRRAISRGVAEEMGINADTTKLLEFLRRLDDGY